MFLFFQDVKNRRNPRLVPYTLLDERTKKSNKDSLREAVRTLLGYGFNLEAPDQDHGTRSLWWLCSPVQNDLLHNPVFLTTAAQSDINGVSTERFRIFRAEKTYSVHSGKWYFELEVRGGHGCGFIHANPNPLGLSLMTCGLRSQGEVCSLSGLGADVRRDESGLGQTRMSPRPGAGL